MKIFQKIILVSLLSGLTSIVCEFGFNEPVINEPVIENNPDEDGIDDEYSPVENPKTPSRRESNKGSVVTTRQDNPVTTDNTEITPDGSTNVPLNTNRLTAEEIKTEAERAFTGKNRINVSWKSNTEKLFNWDGKTKKQLDADLHNESHSNEPKDKGKVGITVKDGNVEYDRKTDRSDMTYQGALKRPF